MPLLVCFQIGEGFFFHLLIGRIKEFTTVRKTFMRGFLIHRIQWRMACGESSVGIEKPKVWWRKGADANKGKCCFIRQGDGFTQTKYWNKKWFACKVDYGRTNLLWYVPSAWQVTSLNTWGGRQWDDKRMIGGKVDERLGNMKRLGFDVNLFRTPWNQYLPFKG